MTIAKPVTPSLRGADAHAPGASEQRFRALLEHSSDVIMLLGADGTVLYASQSTSSVLGYGPTDNVDRHVFELIHPDDRPGALELFAELMQRSEEHTSELQSRSDLVCRLLLEKKKKLTRTHYRPSNAAHPR